MLDWYDGGWYSGGGSACGNCANLTGSGARLIRGGGFYASASYLRAAFRYSYYAPALRYHGFGFRCARSP